MRGGFEPSGGDFEVLRTDRRVSRLGGERRCVGTHRVYVMQDVVLRVLPGPGTVIRPEICRDVASVPRLKRTDSVVADTGPFGASTEGKAELSQHTFNFQFELCHLRSPDKSWMAIERRFWSLRTPKSFLNGVFGISPTVVL
jgi:hypothetical protein